MSLLLRSWPRLLPLAAALAVAEAAGEGAEIKWPNDVQVAGRKVAGILVEGRPQEGWTVLGIGVNVALAPEDLPSELRDRAGTLGRPASDIEPLLEALLASLERWLHADAGAVLTGFRARGGRARC
jgi:BirA family biotin operon repressor/biotin-[acetyl-CoA-carboxylase] ligase